MSFIDDYHVLIYEPSIQDILKFTIFVSLLILLTCCSNPEAVKYKDFEKTVDASTALETVKVAPFLFKERSMVATNDFLISLGSDEDTLFRVFDHANGKYVGGFGKKGNGPNEFASVIASSLRGHSGNSFYVGGLKKSHIYSIKNRPSDTNLNGLNIELISEIKTPGALIPFNESFYVNDSIIAGRKSFRSIKQLTFFNVNSGEIGDFFEFPDLYPQIPQPAKHHFFLSYFNISRDKSKIVTAYAYTPLIRIYDIAESSVKNVYFKPLNMQPQNLKVLPNQKSVSLDELYFYYQDVKVSDNHIYARYQEGQFLKGGDRLISENQIHVLDFNGNLVSRVIVEDWVYKYVPTPDDRYLYFWNPQVEDELYRFSLAEIF